MSSICILIALCWPRLDPPGLSDSDIRAAIDTIKTAIIDRHHKRRHWDPAKMPTGESTRQRVGGYTALACLALVTAGHPWHVEPLRSAIDALSKGEGTGTYTVALRVLLFASLPDRFRPRLEADVQTLLAGFDAQRHGWPYACGASTSRGTISPSVRHMALLALRSAADAGIEIDGRVVGAAASALLSEVRPDGGWSYRQSDASTGSMTAAAVASILLAMDTNTNMGVRKDRSTALDAVRGGMRWLDDNFKPHPPPGGGRSRGFPTYWLYALERTAMETGRRTLGGVDWFAASARTLIARLLDEEGRVKRSLKGTGGLRQLCLGLLVLHRGRVPLCASVLVPDLNDPPPSLVRMVVNRLSSRSEQGHAWQAVTVEDSLETWLEAPMLLVPPGLERIDEPSASEALRRYVDHGGTVVFAGRGGAFVKRARAALGKQTSSRRWQNAPPGRSPRNLVAPARSRPVPAHLLTAHGRLVAWLVLDRPDRNGGWSDSMMDALLDAWGTATERMPFHPRLSLPAPPTPIDANLIMDWGPLPPRPCIDRLVSSAGSFDDSSGVILVAGREWAADDLWTRAVTHSDAGRPVLIACEGGDVSLARDVLRSVSDRHLARPWWPAGAAAPRWRPYSRQTCPERAVDLPLLLRRPTASSAGIVLAPCDVLEALLERPGWGVHGLDAPSARALLAGLLQLDEDAPHASRKDPEREIWITGKGAPAATDAPGRGDPGRRGGVVVDSGV